MASSVYTFRLTPPTVASGSIALGQEVADFAIPTGFNFQELWCWK